MVDNTRLIIRLGFVAVVILGGILIIVGLQRAIVGLGQLRSDSLAEIDPSINPNATNGRHQDDVDIFTLNTEKRTGLSLTTKWAQSVLCVST